MYESDGREFGGGAELAPRVGVRSVGHGVYYILVYVKKYMDWLPIRCNMLFMLDALFSNDLVEVFPFRATSVCKNAQLAATCEGRAHVFVSRRAQEMPRLCVGTNLLCGNIINVYARSAPRTLFPPAQE